MGEFTVSPVTGDIAFLRQSYEYFSDGSYKVTHKLSILQPETGYITDLTTLPQGRYDYGMDWSPDGGDIIYCASTVEGRGIFRINLTDGSQPYLLLPYTDDNTVPFNYPHYYEGGSRIIFGNNNENNVLTLYSVDENGNDLQQVGEFTGHTFLQGILD